MSAFIDRVSTLKPRYQHFARSVDRKRVPVIFYLLPSLYSAAGGGDVLEHLVSVSNVTTNNQQRYLDNELTSTLFFTAFGNRNE